MTTPQRIEMIDADDPPEGRGFASRKFLLALLVVVGAAGLLWADKIDAARWVDVTTWALGLYMLGNGATAWAAVWGRR